MDFFHNFVVFLVWNTSLSINVHIDSHMNIIKNVHIIVHIKDIHMIINENVHLVHLNVHINVHTGCHTGTDIKFTMNARPQDHFHTSHTWQNLPYTCTF